MRLSYFDIGLDIHFKENEVVILVIENQQIYTDFLQNLMAKNSSGEGKILLSENNKKLAIQKLVSVVYSPFLLDLNNKKIISSLYQELKEISDEYFFVEKENINIAIISYLDDLILKVPYAVKFHLELDTISLLKQYEVQLDMDNVSVFEKLLTYIQLERMLCGTKLLVFVNIKAYLSDEELKELYQTAFYNKIYLLLLETAEKDMLFSEKYIIIDKDKCVIYP